ncbi:MAG: RNA methyltransferase [Holophagales bacterium]|jgi:TrmH family RNA methyltransferase|nr:RNA methyltransferase [Holophagales bacterium]
MPHKLMNLSEPILLSSKSNSRFKQMRTTLAVSGVKRTHTILLGEKLILEWFESKPLVASNRLWPIRWLRLEGHKTHHIERELKLETWELSENLMRDISDTASPPSLALVMELGDEPCGTIADLVIVPWGIQDPGNLGAILRSAAAFGFQEAILGPGCADPFNPKALRGSMGAAFTMPLRRFDKKCFADGRWIALDSEPNALLIESVDLSVPLRLMVGNEGHGWRDVELPEHCVRTAIPISKVESLNAAVAVGIACYEAAKKFKGYT